MSLWNQYKTTSNSVGGGVPVWAVQPERRISGGMVQNTLLVGEKVSAGTPMYYDYTTHQAKLLKCWKIKTATVNGSNTDLVLYRTFLTPELRAGINIMVAPSTISGTGKSVTVTAVNSSVETEYSLSVVTANIDALVANGFLVEAASQGSAVQMYCQPDNLSIEDTIGGDQNSIGVPRGMKYVFENTIPFMPAVVKNNIKNIEWESFNEKQ